MESAVSDAKQGSLEAPEVLFIRTSPGASAGFLTRFHGFESDIGDCTRFVRGDIAEGLLDLLVRCRATHGLGKFLDEDVAEALNAGFKE